jgi:hypothetical protein
MTGYLSTPGAQGRRQHRQQHPFLDSKGKGSSALVYLGDVAPPSCLAQGTLYAKSTMGKLWAGNTLPKDNCDQYSTVAAALPIPPAGPSCESALSTA